MTTREKLEEMVFNNGVFESDAKKIVELSEEKINNLAAGYTVTMDSPSEDYSDAVYNVLYIAAVKPTAKEYIAKNKPNAWYRPMFD